MEKGKEFAVGGARVISKDVNSTVHPLSGADKNILEGVYSKELGRGVSEIVSTRPLVERSVNIQTLGGVERQ